MKTIKQLKPFWIYLLIHTLVSFLVFLVFLISELFVNLIFLWSLQHVPLTFIFPGVSSLIVSYNIIKNKSITLKKTFKLGIIMFLSMCICLSLPWINSFFTYGIYDYLINPFYQIFTIMPPLVFTVIFIVVSLITVIYRKKTEGS